MLVITNLPPGVSTVPSPREDTRHVAGSWELPHRILATWLHLQRVHFYAAIVMYVGFKRVHWGCDITNNASLFNGLDPDVPQSLAQSWHGLGMEILDSEHTSYGERSVAWDVAW